MFWAISNVLSTKNTSNIQNGITSFEGPNCTENQDKILSSHTNAKRFAWHFCGLILNSMESGAKSWRFRVINVLLTAPPLSTGSLITACLYSCTCLHTHVSACSFSSPFFTHWNNGCQFNILCFDAVRTKSVPVYLQHPHCHDVIFVSIIPVTLQTVPTSKFPGARYLSEIYPSALCNSRKP